MFLYDSNGKRPLSDQKKQWTKIFKMRADDVKSHSVKFKWQLQ